MRRLPAAALDVGEGLCEPGYLAANSRFPSTLDGGKRPALAIPVNALSWTNTSNLRFNDIGLVTRLRPRHAVSFDDRIDQCCDLISLSGGPLDDTVPGEDVQDDMLLADRGGNRDQRGLVAAGRRGGGDDSRLGAGHPANGAGTRIRAALSRRNPAQPRVGRQRARADDRTADFSGAWRGADGKQSSQR